MAKRIIQQARGHGSLTYRVRPSAYRYTISYPQGEGKAKVLRLINSAGHSAPLAKMRLGKEIFFTVAVDGLVEGQEVEVGRNAPAVAGNITSLSNIPTGSSICNLETVPFAGPKLVRTSGLTARVTKKTPLGVFVQLPSKKEKIFNERARVTVGSIAGAGRLEKPIVKAGKAFHMMKARNKLWPRTSAVKMNAVDHPFGSGRGKRIKSKIAKRNAPPGAKVGHIRPRRTGRRKK